jgi:hypothetical protein
MNVSVSGIQVSYTQGAALADLKLRLDELARGSCHGYMEDDFKSESEF